MQKITVLAAILLLLFGSCKKESKSLPSTNSELIRKINLWLDNQKSSLQPNKASNIEALKGGLDFTGLKIENSEGGERIYVIPISESFKASKAIHKNKNVNLVLVETSAGLIRKGNVVLFSSANGALSKLPENTFYHILNATTPEIVGEFRFLSVSGTFLYNLTYKNKKLYSAGIIRRDESAISGARVESSCTDWYLETTYYYSDGTTEKTSEYLGRTCQGCDPQVFDGICPDYGGGSSGSGGGGDSEFDEAAEAALKAEVLSTIIPTGGQAVSYTSPDDAGVPFNWVVIKNASSLWEVTSSDIAKGYNRDNIGQIMYDIIHVGSSISGQIIFHRIPRNPGGTPIQYINLTWQETSNSKTIASDYKSGTITVSGILSNMGVPFKNPTTRFSVWLQ